MVEFVVFGVPLIIWLACSIAAYYRLTQFNPKTENKYIRFLAYVIHFLITMLSGVVMYQSVLNYAELSEHLAVVVAMAISLISEGIAKAIIRLSNDYSIVKDFLLDLIRRIFGFK